MKRREPNFDNFLTVLRNEVPERPTLFELYLNDPIYVDATGLPLAPDDYMTVARARVGAFCRLGYDYASIHASDFRFQTGRVKTEETVSLNAGNMITDEGSFDAYEWADPDDFDYSRLNKVKEFLPDGMKIMVLGPGGVLENVIALTGYDNLCFMLYEEPELVKRIFDEVGSRMLRYYENALQYDSVGVISSNDDWGFNTQPFISPAHMCEYLFLWHKRIVDAVHAAGRPVLLHSCGNLDSVFDELVALGYDAKHSFEDNIIPIEDAYEKWHPQIALLGGFDVNYLCTQSADEIKRRTRAMLERTSGRGGWAVGTGNSVAPYIPRASYLAMLEAALGYNPMA